MGKLADLALLDGNPIENIRNTRRFAAFVAAGRLFTKAEMADLLGKQERADGRGNDDG